MLRIGHPLARTHAAPRAPLRGPGHDFPVLRASPAASALAHLDNNAPAHLLAGPPRPAATAPADAARPHLTPAPSCVQALQAGAYEDFCQASLVTAMALLHAASRFGRGAQTTLVDSLACDPYARQIMMRWLSEYKIRPAVGSEAAHALDAFFLIFSEAMPQETLWLQTCAMPHLFGHLTGCADALTQLRYDTRGPRHPACTLEAVITALLTLPTTQAEQSIHWQPYLNALHADPERDAAFARLLARFAPAFFFGSEHWALSPLSAAAQCAEALVRAWPNGAASMRRSTAAWSQISDAVAEQRAPSPEELHALQRACLAEDAVMLQGLGQRPASHPSVLWHRTERFIGLLVAQSQQTQHTFIDAICAPHNRAHPASHMFAIRRLNWPGLDALAAPQLARLLAALPVAASGMALPVPTWLITRAMQAEPESMVQFVGVNQSAIVRRWVPDTTGVLGYPTDVALDPPEQAEALIAACAARAPMDAQRLQAAFETRRLQQGLPYLRQSDVAGLSDYSVLQREQNPDSRWSHLRNFIATPIDARALHHLARARTRLWYAAMGRPTDQQSAADAALSRALGDTDRFAETPLIPVPWNVPIAPMMMPLVLKQALRAHTRLDPGLASYLLADKPGAQRHRRMQVGRLWAMVQVAQVPDAVVCAHHVLFSALVRTPGAHKWPLASLAFVFFALRDDETGARCRTWLHERQRSAHPSALLVALHTLGTFGIAYCTQPSVGHTLDLLLRARHHADKMILAAQDRFNDARIDLFDPMTSPGDIALMPELGAIGHILQGPAQWQIAQWLLADLYTTHTSAGSSPRKVQRRQTIARRLAQAHVSMLRAHAPQLSDVARLDALAALRAYDEAHIAADPGSTPAAAWFDIAVHTRHVRDLAGTKIAPLLLTLLQHAHDLPDLQPQTPSTLRQALNRYNAPDDVLAATPALTDPTLWVAWQKKAARRADSRGCAASYAAGLDAYEPSYGRVFREALSAWANGSWQTYRFDNTGAHAWLHTLSESDRRRVEAFYQGDETPLTHVLGPAKGQPYHLVDTDDLLHILFSGQDVDGSCQHLQAEPAYNCGLLGRLTDATKRMLAIRDSRDKIVARCIFYLVRTLHGAPLLYLGPLYVSRKIDRQAAVQTLFDYAQIRARALQLPLAATSRQIWPEHEMSREEVAVSISGNGMPDYIDGLGIHYDHVWLHEAHAVRLTS